MKENPFAQFEDKADPLVPTATLQVYTHIDEVLGRRKVDKHINRASSATMCYKRRWYQKQGIKGIPLTPRKLVNFLMGDIAERCMLYFIKEACVGPGKLYSKVDFGTPTGTVEFQGKSMTIYKQEDLVAKLGKKTVTAHADGWGKRNIDGKWELIECKSAANYGFNKFKTTGPEDYLKQAHMTLLTTKALKLKAKSVRFFYLRKETGHLWDKLYLFDQKYAKEVLNEYKLADGKKEPKAPYKPELNKLGQLEAKFPCTYCPFIKLCQGPFKTIWKKDGYNTGIFKPIYVFKTVKKE